MNLLLKLFGDPNEKILKGFQPRIARINELEPSLKTLFDSELRARTEEFKKRLNEGETLDDLLPEAFAVVREAAVRSVGMRHFDVQLLGGMILHQGSIAEMKTGEGKTLVATLPLYLNALAGKGCHLITVNDYLAKRDTVWMGKIYHFLGLSVGCIQHDAAFVYDPEYKANARKSSDPSHTSPYQGEESKFPLLNKEGLGEVSDGDAVKTALVKVEMDYLRPVTRKEAYAADIIYGTNNEFGFDYLRDNMVPRLQNMVQRGLHYAIVDEVDSILIDEARTPLIISAPDTSATEKYYEFSQLVARLEENVDYNVDEKLRAATLTEEGIAKMEKWLGIENIYVERGMREVHHIESALRARALFKRDRDYVVKDNEVIIVDEFTGRLMYGRRYSEGLHQAIEAQENVPIQRESITMATITFQNYFRMYQKLAGMTGTALTEAEEFHKIYNLETVVVPTNRPLARKDLPDRVYRNERGKLTAIIEEIRKRHASGQPILVGTISIEKNEVLSEALTSARVPHEVLNAKNHEREAQIIANAGKIGAVTIATNMAGRGVDIVFGGNPPDSAQAEEVRTLGGLCVIGTERHESRRIDNQLRGRGGRQGDPGMSLFFVSMEDDLMRIFGSDRMKGIMERLGLPEDQPIEHTLISKSIEQAQKKVEGHNFDIRKHLVEYDDVINKHREVIYRKRREILASGIELTEEARTRLQALTLSFIEKEIEQVVSFHTASGDMSEWNLDEIYETVDALFPVPLDVRLKLEDIEQKSGGAAAIVSARESIVKYLTELSQKSFDSLKERINDDATFSYIVTSILTRSIDMLWVEHLDAIDHLRKGIGLRGYGQRDPLVEYKKEAFRMFQELQNNIQKQVASSIFKVGAAKEWYEAAKGVSAVSEVYNAPQKLSGAAKTGDEASSAFSGTQALPAGERSISLPGSVSSADNTRNRAPAGQKIGRNDPCWCGSGKKFKKCHGA